MFSDFPVIFFDDDVFLTTRIEEAQGEFARVRGTVTAYEYKSKRRSKGDRTQLQIVVKVPQQVVISDTAPGAPSRTSLTPVQQQPEDAEGPYDGEQEGAPPPPPPEAPDPDAPPQAPPPEAPPPPEAGEPS